MPLKLIRIDGNIPGIDTVLGEHRIKLGKNVVFGGPCYFGDAVTVGDGVVLSAGARIGGHTVIESGAKLGARCDIGEGSYVGQNVVIADNVSLPKRTYIGVDRGNVDRSEEFTAVFSSGGKVEAFFGSDRILMFDPEIGQDYETSLSFREFVTKTKIRQRIKVKQEERRGEFLKTVSSLIGVIKNIGERKKQD